MSTRKPRETPKETPEQKEKREKAEKIAEELLQQEAKEKMKQAAKDAKSKKAAAENTQRRPVRLQLSSVRRKSKQQKAEPTPAQKRRLKAVTPANDPVDQTPPDGDDQPWEIYHYRPHVEVDATLAYEEEQRGVRHYDLESAYNLDIRGTRTSYTHGQATTVSESVKVLQHGNRRVREIRAEQIETVSCC